MFNKAPAGVCFGSPSIEAEDPYFGGVGPRRTGCISCGNCNIGCGHNAERCDRLSEEPLRVQVVGADGHCVAVVPEDRFENGPRPHAGALRRDCRVGVKTPGQAVWSP